MNFTDQYIKKIRDVASALAFIRIYPEHQEGYLELYQQYLRSYPYFKKHVNLETIFIASLGPFHFVDTIFDITRRKHEFTMDYNNETVIIASRNNFQVMRATYTREYSFENEFLHTFQSGNAKDLKTSFQDFLYGRK
ncbi:MAG: hypothetical protein KC535_01180 [Nanoarchaeota archaeon]|nr:hypothetical protein [Nanoarchaeota archaeon]